MKAQLNENQASCPNLSLLSSKHFLRRCTDLGGKSYLELGMLTHFLPLPTLNDRYMLLLYIQIFVSPPDPLLSLFPLHPLYRCCWSFSSSSIVPSCGPLCYPLCYLLLFPPTLDLYTLLIVSFIHANLNFNLESTSERKHTPLIDCLGFCCI